jgi:hypothetical protein
MKTAVYFSPKAITLVRAELSGKSINVKKKASCPMPDSAVVNGVINDEESLLADFKQLCVSFGPIKDAVLVMDTTHIIYRLSVLPNASHREMQTLVKAEFVNRNMQDMEYVYDYSVIKSPHLSKGQRLVLSCAVDKNIIDTYKAFFKKAGVGLSGIDFSANAVLQAMAAIGNPWAGKNAIVCVVDYYIVFIINFLAGGEINFFRSRILSTQVDDAYFTEINNAVFSYMQSRKSVNRTEETQVLCMLDNNRGDFTEEEYAQKLGQLGIESIYAGINNIAKVNGIAEAEADLYAYGMFAAAAKTAKNLNFNTVKEPKKLTKRQKTVLTWAIVLTTFTAGSGGSLFYLFNEINRMQREISGYQAYILDPRVRELVTLYNASVSELVTLNDMRYNLEVYESRVGNTAIIERGVVNATTQALRQVDANASITRILFNSERRQLTVDCYTAQSILVSAFVEGLRETGLFSDIVYVRYTSEGGGGYTFTLDCFVKEVKGVE